MVIEGNRNIFVQSCALDSINEVYRFYTSWIEKKNKSSSETAVYVEVEMVLLI
jgi:hypothetical protein